MNHQKKESTSMLTKYTIRGKTGGLALGFPILLRRISLPKKKDMNPKPGFFICFFFKTKTLYVKCSICELLVLNPDLDPLVIGF